VQKDGRKREPLQVRQVHILSVPIHEVSAAGDARQLREPREVGRAEERGEVVVDRRVDAVVLPHEAVDAGDAVTNRIVALLLVLQRIEVE
jgi:hypothetical protein